MKRKNQEDPFLSQIKNKYIHEGNILTASDVDGYSKSGNYQAISAKFKIENEEMIDKGPEALFSKVPEIARDIEKQQSQMILKEIDEVTKRTGNVVDAKSKPISAEIYLQCLETLAINFDEYGNPILPSLVVPHNKFEKTKEAIRKWETEPEFQKKLRSLIEKKRKEWIDRQNRRKLVD